jgi:hypothetical protein
MKNRGVEWGYKVDPSGELFLPAHQAFNRTEVRKLYPKPFANLNLVDQFDRATVFRQIAQLDGVGNIFRPTELYLGVQDDSP